MTRPAEDPRKGFGAKHADEINSVAVTTVSGPEAAPCGFLQGPLDHWKGTSRCDWNEEAAVSLAQADQNGRGLAVATADGL